MNTQSLFELMNISSQMINKIPVFIVGAPRCGTSLLYRILQGHSAFQPRNVTNETQVNLVETKLFSNPYDFEASQDLKAYMLNDKKQYSCLLRKTLWIRRYQSFLRGKSRLHHWLSIHDWNPSFRSLLFSLTAADFMLRLYFYYAQQARGVNRILEKSPNSIYHLPEVKKAFPKAKLIFIYRHPIDAFTSYRKREKNVENCRTKKEKTNWLNISPDIFCTNYARTIDLALKESTLNENFLMIKYENLVQSSQETIKEICSFIGENFEKEMLPTNQKALSDWKPDPELFAEIQPKTKNWQNFISKNEAKIIETQLDYLMKRISYNKYII